VSNVRPTDIAAASDVDLWTPIMRSPISRLQAELGARFEREAGWELPASYGDPHEERALLRSRIAVADVTARSKLDLRGRSPSGTAFDVDGELVARVSADWTLLLGPPRSVVERIVELEALLGDGGLVTDATHLFAGYILGGPRLPDAMARLTGWDIATLVPGSAAGAPIAEVRAVIVARDLAIPMIEIYVATEFARFVWRAILRVVQGLGGGAAGWEALRAEGWR
jgi:glycine cleavage system aminomethyltransferase T